MEYTALDQLFLNAGTVKYSLHEQKTETYIRIPTNVSELLISVYGPANFFSYATNISRPQESGYRQATYKKGKHVKHTKARRTQHVRVVQW